MIIIILVTVIVPHNQNGLNGTARVAGARAKSDMVGSNNQL